jgi:methyl-accepting chemotaxis protein
MNSIRRKVQGTLVGSILVISLCAATVLFINQLSARKNQQIIETMTKEYGIITATGNLISKFNDVVKNSDDQALLSEYASIKSSLLDTIDSLDQEILYEESRAVFIGLENNVMQVVSYCDLGIKEVVADNFLNISDHFANANKHNTFVQDSTSTLLQKELEYLSAGEAQSRLITNITLLVSFGLFACLNIVTMFFASHFSKQLVLPLEKLSETTRRVVDGDLDITVDNSLINQQDEVGVLSTSFAHMINAIKFKINELSASNKNLEDSRKSVEASNLQLGKLNSFMVGRELKMIELKKKIAELEKSNH